MKYLLPFVICALLAAHAFGQECGTPGQTLVDPFYVSPVCGTTVFVQDSVPACTNGLSFPGGCSVGGIPYTGKNPFWYNLYCLKSGTLGFTISPEDSSDDFNWILFDVTGHLFADIYKDSSLVVGDNWSGKGGNTGASADGKDAVVCPAAPHNLYPSPFSKMPHLTKGHIYLLLVSHYTGTAQHGYTLYFGGGTAVLTHTVVPRLKEAQVSCDGRTITVLLNTDTIKIGKYVIVPKGIRPGSLAPDGSDFKLLHTAVGIRSASAASTNFYITKFILQLDGQLKPGSYTLAVQKGTDGNTLLNKCGIGIPAGDTLALGRPAIPPTPMRNVVSPGCTSIKSIQLVFNGAIRCRSIAKDGSDFSIVDNNTGKYLAATGAKGVDCNNGFCDTIQVDLKKSIYKKGTFHLTLQTGNDGNTLINACDVASPPGQTLTFVSPGAVSAVITSRLRYACNRVNVTLSNPGGNGVYQWVWRSSSGKTGGGSSLSFIDTTFQTETVRLRVSNGVCSDEDSIILQFNRDYYLHAGFTLPSTVCPQDPVSISNESKGADITQWNWNFGDGKYSNRENPGIHHYPAATFTKKYPVRLAVTNSRKCSDTAVKEITVYNTCQVYVPTAFTPDHDGKNDYLHPLDAFLAKDLSFKVYNRWGQLVFQTWDRTRGWDGTLHGKPLPEGAYIWMLSFINSKTGKKVFRKGSTLLIR